MHIAGIFKLTMRIVSDNLKIVFGGKFIYFLIAALSFYFVFTGVMLFSDSKQDDSTIYGFLIFPGILTAFYPAIYSIQNDKDSRMIEMIFSVPDYRYKVYLVRFIIAVLLMWAALLFMAGFTWFAIIQIPVLKMVYHLMFPLTLIACIGFLFSTIARNGNAAAVIVIVIGLIFFLLQQPLASNRWNIFLNPFWNPGQMSETIWITIVRQNRLILAVASIVSLLWAFINLQRREKFL